MAYFEDADDSSLDLVGYAIIAYSKPPLAVASSHQGTNIQPGTRPFRFDYQRIEGSS